MVFKKFYINLIIRVVIITLNCLGLGITGFRSELVFTFILLSLLLILQVVLLINYLNRINDQLEIFFDYIKNEEPGISIRDSGSIFKGKSVRNYFTRLSEIIAEFRKRERSWYFLLQHTIEHISIGIIVLNDRNKVSVSNRAARDIFGLAVLGDIEDIRSKYSGIAYQIENIKNGEKRIYKSLDSGEIDTFLIRADEFNLYQEKQKLISIQSIRSELQDKETESWQKLIRVLTHEINNTVSPLSSLSGSIRENLNIAQYDTFEDPAVSILITETLQGINLIDERTKGMLKFIKQFRSVTLPPSLEANYFPVASVFSDLEKLFGKEFTNNLIEFKWGADPPDIAMFADKKLFEQVMINLIRNAIEAHIENQGGDKYIHCIVENTRDDKISIKVSDNAGGIVPEIFENIFMPMFTTKMNGSGIGLSFSRMVIQKHNGTLTARTEPGKGSVFNILL